MTLNLCNRPVELAEKDFVTKQSNHTRQRPKPGPNKTAHGTVRRRTGGQSKSTPRREVASSAPPVAKRPKPGPRRPAQQERRLIRQIQGEDDAGRGSIPHRRQRPKAEAIEGERRVIRWWLIGVIVLAVAIIVSVLEAPLFEARSVQLSGNARTSEGSVHDALAIPEDQALLLYDIDVAESAVAELPWVEDVSIARQWPGTVQVVIREHPVAASIGRPDGSEWLVIAASGVVVERRATPPGSVPLIVGTDQIVDLAEIGEPVDEASRALAIALDVPGQLDPWITTWSLDEEGQLTAELVGRAEANFGAFEDSRTQFVSLASILNGGAELTCLDRIDLSVADTPVLYRSRACINEAAELG